MVETCGQFIYLWDGEYESTCLLPAHEEGDHWDGTSWVRGDVGHWEFVDDEHGNVGPTE